MKTADISLLVFGHANQQMNMPFTSLEMKLIQRVSPKAFDLAIEDMKEYLAKLVEGFGLPEKDAADILSLDTEPTRMAKIAMYCVMVSGVQTDKLAEMLATVASLKINLGRVKDGECPCCGGPEHG